MNLSPSFPHTSRALVFEGPRSLQSASRAYRLEQQGEQQVEVETSQEQLNFRNGAVVRDSLDRYFDRTIGAEVYSPYLEIVTPQGEQRVVPGAVLEPVPGDARPAVSFAAFDSVAGVERDQWTQTLLPEGGCEFFQQCEGEERYLLVTPDGKLTSEGFSEYLAPEGLGSPRLVDGKIQYNDFGDRATLEPAIPLEWLTVA